MTESKTTNRLADETSPYLLQHQYNPVDWYPWGPEALEKAKEEQKLILLSIGYSACHWCHVMERESFEDEDIAALMNEHLVCIKVDREERPDVDHVYMQVVQALTGRGGWPLTVFLTPDCVPVFGGTYFPPSDRGGMPGFPRVIRAVVEGWERQPEELTESAAHMIEQLRSVERPEANAGELSESIAGAAFESISGNFDDVLGGLSGAPKFPQPMIWAWLLKHWVRTGDERARAMVELTLKRMARGGMADQLGGGFHRYSVDARWLVPHFEKMLYDNAQLAALYIDAFSAFGNPAYKRVAEETLDYMVREMRHEEGGFFSSQDADSEGEEGKFFVWTRDEVRDVLGDSDETAAAMAYWGLDDAPNFEGSTILNVPHNATELAERLDLTEPVLTRIVGEAREKLFDARERRVKPGRDDKILAAWNGLACRAFAQAARALGRPDYLDVAIRNGDFLLDKMRRDDGRLLRSWKDGDARLAGYLEDYASTIDGLLALHAATLDRRWLDAGVGLSDEMIRLFWDSEQNGFYDTGIDQEQLVVRPREAFDNASPCGNSMAADVLLRLAVLTGSESYRQMGTSTLRSAARLMERYPSGAGRFLSVLDFYLGPVAEVALVWPEGDEPEALLSALTASYRPNLVVDGKVHGVEVENAPLLESRPVMGDAPTAYLCQNYACQLPTNDAKVLAEQLEGLFAQSE